MTWGKGFSLSTKQWHLFIVVSSSAIVLLLLNYVSSAGLAGFYFYKYLKGFSLSENFSYVLGWAIFTTTLYLTIPILTILLLKHKLSDYGLVFNLNGAYLYWVFPVFIIPVTFIVSMDSQFQAVYPFLHYPDSLSTLLIWEFFYILQFFALEFFFRGFMLHGLRRSIDDFSSIVICAIPYMMIHFAKPAVEALSSFFGSMLLSYFSIRYQTILLGLYAHMLLAVSMDVFSLYHRGWF